MLESSVIQKIIRLDKLEGRDGVLGAYLVGGDIGERLGLIGVLRRRSEMEEVIDLVWLEVTILEINGGGSFG